LSALTISYHHRIVGSVMQYAVENSIITSNPTRRMKPPKAPKTEAAYYDDAQALALIEALESAPLKWRTAVMLLLYSGMRRGEACGLEWSDIDFDASTAAITKAAQYLTGKGMFTKEPKTATSRRVVKLPEEMVALLLEHRRQQSDEKEKLGDSWQGSDRIFTTENGAPMHPDSLTHWLGDFCAQNGLPRITPHGLRHTSATLLINAGAPVKAISAMLGHSSQNVTNAIYSHSIQSAVAAASDTLGDILRPTASKAKGRAADG
jgi:integrase